MKKILLIIGLSLIVSFNLFSQKKADSMAVKETALNYIEGWYGADTARMNKSLFVDLSKVGILPVPKSKDTKLVRATYTDMLNWTGRKPNELKINKDLKIHVVIIEMGKNVANVKTISKDFIDYLHIARINGEWKILHALWEPNLEK